MYLLLSDPLCVEVVQIEKPGFEPVMTTTIEVQKCRPATALYLVAGGLVRLQ